MASPFRVYFNVVSEFFEILPVEIDQESARHSACLLINLFPSRSAKERSYNLVISCPNIAY